ncbi:YciI-like protein [Paenibacillus konkukensis]|uniref:YciI-like protein n=1 Tax=Paenibacillus konkukensis TaxID=2020716 RepID=A0ABY4RWU0_9BACL|nr:YciI family protein [Paenibacillus konkukensis]UQZ86156.1 YciI-like protein [Paenibacillus konkukensis]
MSIFVCLLPMLDAEKSAQFREEHLAHLDRQRSLGRIIANGRFADGWGGMVIYKAESLGEVKAWAENDPYVIKKARTYDIHEWDMVSEHFKLG